MIITHHCLLSYDISTPSVKTFHTILFLYFIFWNILSAWDHYCITNMLCTVYILDFVFMPFSLGESIKKLELFCCKTWSKHVGFIIPGTGHCISYLMTLNLYWKAFPVMCPLLNITWKQGQKNILAQQIFLLAQQIFVCLKIKLTSKTLTLGIFQHVMQNTFPSSHPIPPSE